MPQQSVVSETSPNTHPPVCEVLQPLAVFVDLSVYQGHRAPLDMLHKPKKKQRLSWYCMWGCQLCEERVRSEDNVANYNVTVVLPLFLHNQARILSQSDSLDVLYLT